VRVVLKILNNVHIQAGRRPLHRNLHREHCFQSSADESDSNNNAG